MPLLLVHPKYTFTKYSQSLNSVIEEMKKWGIQHRRRIMKKEKK
jgi:DNA-binding HxlR family transcriptional regulator